MRVVQEQSCSTWSTLPHPQAGIPPLGMSNQECGSLDTCLLEVEKIPDKYKCKIFAIQGLAGHLGGCVPKYLENFSALSVALMRMTLRSSRSFSRSFTMVSKTSDCRFLSWISSSTRWLTLDNNLTHKQQKRGEKYTERTIRILLVVKPNPFNVNWFSHYWARNYPFCVYWAFISTKETRLLAGPKCLFF